MKEPGKPKPCWHGDGSECVSSDPHFTYGFISNGDTTGCVFHVVLTWGDGKTTSKDLDGAANGDPIGSPITHDYPHPGPFAFSWTADVKVNSGSCSNTSGNGEFLLITAGIYADFQRESIVSTAVKDGWSMIANVAGKGRPSGCKSPWTGPTNNDSDSSVEKVLSRQSTPYPAWISYWTVAVPPSGQPFYDAGYAAGQEAAENIESAASTVAKPVAPSYVTLDFESSDFDVKRHKETGELSCGHKRPAGQKKPQPGDKLCWDRTSKKVRCFQATAADWENFATGWADGIKSYTSPVPLTPAIYVNKGEYNDKKFGVRALAADADLPVIVAVAPILSTEDADLVTGPHVIGYAAYGIDSGRHKEPAVCAEADKYIQHVKTWGGITSLQFTGSKYCPPNP